VIDVSIKLLKWFPLEERIYRMRCVEAWSMVIPWVGFPARRSTQGVEPTSRAKYVAFTTLLDPAQMPEQRRRVLDLAVCGGPAPRRSDAPADNFLAVGLYGKALPTQNGCPLRVGGALEVRLQRHQVDREDHAHREAAADNMESGGASRVRVLRQREIRRSRPSALGVRRANAASANCAAGRRCRSTATPSRSRACTAAWTSRYF